MPIGPGTKLGQYVVQEAIGEGAMGVVYKAYHPQLERTGAVKVLHGIGLDVDSTARFRREAQAIAHMRHPNVLNVFDFGEFEGTPYMIVEYVPGGSLASRLNRGALDTRSALAYLQGIGEALDYAHKHGIVHRDVKPANVLMGPDDNPILADFGLAKLMESSSIKSLTGVTTGTPAYMAPEQVSGRQVGPAADRYSLAVMAYEMLTGSLPFEEGGVLEVLYAQVHRDPSAPSTVNPSLGPRVDSVILRGMAKDPNARWNRCGDLVAALETALLADATPGPEKTIAMASPAIEKTVAVAPPPVVFAPPPTTRKRSPKPVTAEVGGTSIFAGENAVGALRGPDPTVPHPVITWRGVKVPAQDKGRNRRRTAIGIAVVALLLLLGVCGYVVLLPPTLHLSRSIVAPGDTVIVTANHIPSGQVGTIELHSMVLSWAFKADTIGRVTRQIMVPPDEDLGWHRVYICWGGGCHANAPLQVVSSLALLPTPDSPSAGPSSSPHASQSPSPHSTPGATPYASPKSSPPPVRSPAPSPRPAPSPSPTPKPPAYITISPGVIVAGVTLVTVNGHNFTPGKTVTVKYYDPGSSSTPLRTFTTTVTSSGSFSGSFTPGLLDPLGTAKITAADTSGRSAYATCQIT